MANDYFEFKHFRINQPGNVFRVGTDGVLLGAWAGAEAAGGIGRSISATGRSLPDVVGSIPGSGRSIPGSIRSILDVGTGTGLIALMLAQRFPGASVTAIEPDKASFEAAEANLAASKWSSSVEVINSSLVEFASSCSGEFDLIVSNPPFFTGSLKNPDPVKASFRHSDSSCLSTAIILEQSRRLMTKDGLLSLILPWAEGNVMIAEAASSGLYCSRMVKIRPFHNSPFNRVLLEFTSERTSPSVKILTMGHPAKGGYSRDYIDLTKEFYLNF